MCLHSTEYILQINRAGDTNRLAITIHHWVKMNIDWKWRCRSMIRSTTEHSGSLPVPRSDYRMHVAPNQRRSISRVHTIHPF